MTYRIARWAEAWAAAWDCADRHRRQAGRAAWNAEDYQVAIEEFNRLCPDR